MRVSIVTAVRNARDRIGITLESVVRQTWRDREIIVVDGFSTDGTLDVVRGYSPHIDRLIVERDYGIYDAMNKGIAAATGEWLLFMNAGDIFKDTRVLERIAGLLNDPRPLLCGRYEKVWGGRATVCRPGPLRLGVMPSSHQATFVRTEAARRHPFDISLRVGADYDQLCRIVQDSSPSIQYTDIVIATVEGEGFATAHVSVAYSDYRKIIVRHFGWSRGWAWYIKTVGWTTLTALVKAVVPSSVTAHVRRLRLGAP